MLHATIRRSQRPVTVRPYEVELRTGPMDADEGYLRRPQVIL
jgi:hypothetical protein